MANRLQFKKGSGAPGNIFYAGEPVYDKSGKILYIGDDGGTGTGTGSSIASEDTYKASLEMLYRATTSDSGQIRLYEDTDNGTNYVAIAASAALGSSYTLRLPDSDGDDGQVLKTDGSGNLAWVNQTSGFSGFTISDGSNTSSITDSNTVTFTSGEGIDAVVTQNGDAVTISAEAATTTNAGIASYQASQFYFEDTYKVGVVTATTSTKGLASFDSDYFVVTDGAVTVKTGGTSGIVTSVIGTINEVDVTSSSGTYQVGLPNNVSITNDLYVGGNLVVVGTAITFQAETVKVEDRLIELGLVGGATTTFSTWDLGVAFNYGDGSTAKKSGVFWIDNQFVGIASVIATPITGDSGITTSDPQVSITTFAPLVASDLYLGGFTANDLVINSAKEAINLIFDGGSY